MPHPDKLIFIGIVAVSLAVTFGISSMVNAGATAATNTIAQQQGASSQNATNITLAASGYATYAYLISSPITNSTAQRAIAGFNITQQELANGSVRITIAAVGNPTTGGNYTILPGEKLYYIDLSLGDDSAPSGEYNMGDDGIILTNTAGYIIKG